MGSKDQRASCEIFLFGDGDELDFTTLGAQVISVNDGTNDVPALLLTNDLSQKIQRALREMNQVSRVAKWLPEQQKVVLQQLSEIEDELSRQVFHLQALQKINRSAEDVMACESNIAYLEDRRQATLDWDRRVVERLDDAFATFYNIQGPASFIIRKAFYECNLLSTSEPDPDLDIDEVNPEERESAGKNDHQFEGPDEFCSERESVSENEDYSDDDVDCLEQPESANCQSFNPVGQTTVHPSPSTPKAFLDEEEDTVGMRCTRAVIELQRAEKDFENRQETEEREYHEYVQEIGPGETEEELSLRQLMKNRLRTRRLIEAEENFKALKNEAIQAGMKLGNRGSVFTSGEDDDRTKLSEGEGPYLPEMIWPAAEQWADSLPEEMYDPFVEGSDREPDQWDLETVRIEDSCSIAAEGDEAKKIKQWQAICNEIREREQFATVPEEGQLTLEDFGFVRLL